MVLKRYFDKSEINIKKSYPVAPNAFFLFWGQVRVISWTHTRTHFCCTQCQRVCFIFFALSPGFFPTWMCLRYRTVVWLCVQTLSIHTNINKPKICKCNDLLIYSKKKAPQHVTVVFSRRTRIYCYFNTKRT